MHRDQMRKYGISASIKQALYYDIIGNEVIIRACIIDAIIIIFSFGHYALRIMIYTVYCSLSLVLFMHFL